MGSSQLLWRSNGSKCCSPVLNFFSPSTLVEEIDMRGDHYRVIRQKCSLYVRKQQPFNLEKFRSLVVELEKIEEIEPLSRRTPSLKTSEGCAYKTLSAGQPSCCFAKVSRQEILYDTVLSIYLQQLRWHVRKTSHMHQKAEVLETYLCRLRDGESISEVAKSVQFPPYTLMKRIIKFWNSIMPRESSSLSQVSSAVGSASSGRRGKGEKSDALSLKDPVLYSQLQLAIRTDVYFSPSSDVLRQNIGLEYEYVLQRKLAACKIAFESEDQMRVEGRSKTPDVRLVVPVATRGPAGRHRIVNWIDSKAMFGDPYTHHENMKQLQGYVNRYGPGMVIYWFDFVPSLNEDDPDILVCRDLPTSYIRAVEMEND